MTKVSREDASSTSSKDIDIYRDTPVRLMGYANEVGESFRSLVHVNLVRFSYVISFGYVFADTGDKCRKTFYKSYSDVAERNKYVTLRAIDTFLWQTLASVIIPGFTINRICAMSQLLFRASTSWSVVRQKWTATAIGIGSIPLIVKPIDSGVEKGMDATIRKLYDLGISDYEKDLSDSTQC